MMAIEDGRSPSGPGCQASPSAADASSRSGIPNAGDGHNALFDATVRIEEMWPFPMHEAPDRLVEALADSEGKLPDELKAHFAFMSEDDWDDMQDGGWQARDLVGEAASDMFFRRQFGWLAVAATPVFTPTGSGSASFSWGRYYTKLLFAETADGLLASAAAWAEERYASAMSAEPAETRSGSGPQGRQRDPQGCAPDASATPTQEGQER